ncbi:hypothetical protein F4553_006090 [Allocatelliglobosispora scoriae]|uniref:DUF4328 domain-containing protein n=1 Tax=Allocatelliglobosispora scoriae TaxID=643052 RepID=A0A841BYL8_9ACTN|nr:DUF4328 domain-containing protein [Allocatelliglobosispora scoriae]MBB5872656.1 hypothetical protein [Allocatelliglobosispora scoriae]
MPQTTSIRRLCFAASAGIIAVCLATVVDLAGSVARLMMHWNVLTIDEMRKVTGLTLPPVASLLLVLASGVLFLSWLGRARRNVADLPGARPTYSPGWTVGAWFIPLANLILPALVIADIASASAVPGRFPRRGLLAVVWGWWACFTLHTVGVYVTALLPVTVDDRVLTVLIALFDVLYLATGAFAILMMERIGAAQAAGFENRERRPDPADFPAFTVDSLAPAAQP